MISGEILAPARDATERGNFFRPFYWLFQMGDKPGLARNLSWRISKEALRLNYYNITKVRLIIIFSLQYFIRISFI